MNELSDRQHDAFDNPAKMPAAPATSAPCAKPPHDERVLRTQTVAPDRPIDRSVYEPSGLTAEEIPIVEGGTEPR
jgi:hypothetical protein